MSQGFSALSSLRREVEIGVSGLEFQEMQEYLSKLQKASGLIKIREEDIQPSPALRVGRIFYHGIPRQKEAEAFAEVVRIAGEAPLGKEEPDAEVKIFTTPGCRYCPRAVLAAAKLVAAGAGIELHIYDALEFRELAEEYGVTSVPKIVVNDRVFIEAQTTEGKYRELLLKALEQLNVK